ncbi:MAG: chorismate mutase [Terriglobia bacterium]
MKLETAMDISDWRKKIDELDRSLVKLLNERARCAVEIGKIKRQNGLPIQEPHREQEVLRQAFRANEGPLTDQAIQRVFERIVEEGRALQKRLFEAAEKE